MNLWLAFLGGIIVGWLIEWVIDWYYWRRGVAAFYATESALRRQIESAEAEKAAALHGQEELRAQLQAAQAEIEALRAAAGVATSGVSTPGASSNGPVDSGLSDATDQE